MIEDCFKKGLLRKGKASKDKTKNSIKLAERFLNSAKVNLEIEEHEMAFIALYNSMFHSARALLFLGGITERSHKCMIEYLLEKVRNKEIIEQLRVMDGYRVMRHKVQYLGDSVAKLDVEESIKDAENLLNEVKREVQKKE